MVSDLSGSCNHLRGILPAPATVPWLSRTAAQQQTSIKLGCGCGPTAQGERSPRVLCCRLAASRGGTLPAATREGERLAADCSARSSRP